MKTSIDSKFSELSSVLGEEFKGINLARIKLLALVILALCKVQTVTLEKMALAFDSNSKPNSSLRRIQRFLSEYDLDSDLIAKFIFKLLPIQDKVILSIDRTNWKFGQTNINILMLGVVYKDVAFPLLFTMLDKRGNSDTNERIELIDRFRRLFGQECIESLVADREFVGRQWIEYLNFNEINYHIRIRNNFKIYKPRNNKEYKAFWLFNDLKVGQFRAYDKIIKVNDNLCYISGVKLNKGEFLIIISFVKPQESLKEYKKRWQIEMTFKAMKSSGFDIEKTHLKDLQRIKRLMLIVFIAFLWCYKVGIYLHENIKAITIKTHKRKAQTIFKYGLKLIANVLLNSQKQDDITIVKFLSCTYKNISIIF